jgi:hypothetical protein
LRDILAHAGRQLLVDGAAAGQARGKPDEKQERMETHGHRAGARIGTGMGQTPDTQRVSNDSLQQGKIGLFEVGIKIPNWMSASFANVQILQMKDEILHPPARSHF